MYDGEMSYVCCSLLGKAVDWSIQHLHIYRDTPTCDVRRGRYSKQLVAANPPHTWWYNMSPLRCMSLKRSLHVRTMMDLFYRAPVNGVHSSGWNRNSFLLIHHQCLSSCDDVGQIYLLTLNGNINNISGGLELSLVVSVCGMCRVQPQGEIQVWQERQCTRDGEMRVQKLYTATSGHQPSKKGHCSPTACGGGDPEVLRSF